MLDKILTKDNYEIANITDSFREAFYTGFEFWQVWHQSDLDFNVGSATGFVILSLSFFIFKIGLLKLISLSSCQGYIG